MTLDAASPDDSLPGARTAGHSGLGRALHLWGATLMSLVPPAARRRLGRLRRVLEVRLEGRHLDLVLRRGDRETALGAVPLTFTDPGGDGAALRQTLARRHGGGYDRVVLRLNSRRVLHRVVRVPLAARATLAEAVGYDLDRQTPFGADEVHHGVRERALDRAGGWVHADLEIVRRDEVAPALAALAAARLPPDAMTVAGGAGTDLLPDAARRAPEHLLPRASAALAAVMLILGGVAAYLPLKDLHDTRERLDRRVTAARQAATEVQDLRRQIDALAAREQALYDRRAARPLALDVLAAASEALPTDSFATRLRVNDGTLTLAGYAGNASALLGRLEETPLLTNVRFRSPVTQDNRLSAERFDIAADLANTAGGS